MLKDSSSYNWWVKEYHHVYYTNTVYTEPYIMLYIYIWRMIIHTLYTVGLKPIVFFAIRSNYYYYYHFFSFFIHTADENLVDLLYQNRGWMSLICQCSTNHPSIMYYRVRLIRPPNWNEIHAFYIISARVCFVLSQYDYTLDVFKAAQLIGIYDIED